MNVEEFVEEFGFLLEEPGAPDRNELVAIEKWWVEYGSWAETDLAALIRLTGDRWAALTSWCDTTGYGCQDGTDWVIASNIVSAINSLDQRARQRLDLEETHESFEGLFRKPIPVL